MKICYFGINSYNINKIQEKVKRVLDIWISKDGGIYSKEVLRKIKEDHFQQTTTNDANGGEHHTSCMCL